jgi:hypothetical protein
VSDETVQQDARLLAEENLEPHIGCSKEDDELYIVRIYLWNRGLDLEVTIWIGSFTG